MKGKMKVASCSAILAAERRSSSHTRDDAIFPISLPTADVPDDHGATFADINQRVLTQRLRVVIAANAAMVKLYRGIGCAILEVPVSPMGVRRCT
jgi:hypothetical protein